MVYFINHIKKKPGTTVQKLNQVNEENTRSVIYFSFVQLICSTQHTELVHLLHVELLYFMYMYVFFYLAYCEICIYMFILFNKQFLYFFMLFHMWYIKKFYMFTINVKVTIQLFYTILCVGSMYILIYFYASKEENVTKLD